MGLGFSMHCYSVIGSIHAHWSQSFQVKWGCWLKIDESEASFKDKANLKQNDRNII